MLSTAIVVSLPTPRVLSPQGYNLSFLSNDALQIFLFGTQELPWTQDGAVPISAVFHSHSSFPAPLPKDSQKTRCLPS